MDEVKSELGVIKTGDVWKDVVLNSLLDEGIYRGGHLWDPELAVLNLVEHWMSKALDPKQSQRARDLMRVAAASGAMAGFIGGALFGVILIIIPTWFK